jgi:type VI secretion system protein ImpA
MATPEVLNFTKLLAPIPGDKPTGTDLRADPSSVSDFYVIRDARKTASDAERRLDQGDDTVTPDWRPVLDRGTKVLAEKSKDLEIVAYLIEALVRLRGFPGLRDGFRMASELVEQFWEGLYPAAEEGGGAVEERFSHVLWLNGIDQAGTLIVPVRRIPLCDSANLGKLSFAHYLQAKGLDQLSDSKAKQKRIDEGAITLEMIRSAIAETPPKFYGDLLEDLEQAREQFAHFCAALSAKSGYDPPSSDLKDVIEAYRDVVLLLAKDRIPSPQAAAAAPAAAGTAAQGDGPAAAAGKPVDPSVIRDRNDAMDRLLKIAGYFRTNEPQSVIPYVLEQVVNWGKMSLPDLLAELIPDEGPRKTLFKQVGIKPPEKEKTK